MPHTATHLPLIPPAAQTSPFYPISEMPFGGQMQKALAIADQDLVLREAHLPDPPAEPSFSSNMTSSSAFTAAEARAFLRPRFDEQAMVVASRATPLLFASHRLSFVFSSEWYSADGQFPSSAGLISDHPTETDSPCILALYESGLISRDPARAMMTALITSLKKWGWDLRGYAFAHLDEMNIADLRAQRLIPPDAPIASSRLTDEDRSERTAMPIVAAMKSLLWMLNLDPEADLQEEGRRAEAILQRFDELAVGEGGPELRRERIAKMRKTIDDRRRMQLTADELAAIGWTPEQIAAAFSGKPRLPGA